MARLTAWPARFAKVVSIRDHATRRDERAAPPALCPSEVGRNGRATKARGPRSSLPLAKGQLEEVARTDRVAEPTSPARSPLFGREGRSRREATALWRLAWSRIPILILTIATFAAAGCGYSVR